MSTGQSNSHLPHIFTDEIHNAYLFNRVPARSFGNKLLELSDIKTLVPYKEHKWQSPNSGTVTMAMKLLDDQNPWVVAPHGVGGASIELLAGLPFKNAKIMIDKMDFAKSFLNKKRVNTVMVWSHSETLKGQEDEALARYRPQLRRLHNQYTKAIYNATGQDSLPLFIDQTGSNYGHSRASTLWKYTENNSDAFLTGPKYALNINHYSGFNNRSNDTTHLNPIGYTMQGEYHGIAIYKYLQTGQSKCLQPLNFKVIDKKIIITLHVPVPPLVIDVTSLPYTENYGIEIKDRNGDLIPSRFKIKGKRIIITLNTAPLPGYTVTSGTSSKTKIGGHTFEFTNIRDSQSIVSAAGEEHKLYNWLIEFDYVLQNSDFGIETHYFSKENYYTGPKLVKFSGKEGYNLIAGSHKAITMVGEYRIKMNLKGSGKIRYRLGDHSFFSDQQEFEQIVTVTQLGNGTSGLYQSNNKNPFTGTVSDIEITRL